MSQSHTTALQPVDLDRCGVEVSQGNVTLVVPEEGVRFALVVPEEGLRLDRETVQISLEQVTRVANAAWASLRKLSDVSNSELEATSIKHSGGDSGSAVQGIVRAAIADAFKTLDSKSELDDAEISVDHRIADRALYTMPVKNTDRFVAMRAANGPGINHDLPSKLQHTHEEDLRIDVSIDKSDEVDNGLEVGCSIRLCAGGFRDLPATLRPLVQRALGSLVNKSDDDSIKYEMTYFKHNGKATPELESLFRETILSVVTEAGMTCSTLRDPSHPKAGRFSVKSKYLSKIPMTQDTVTDKARFWLKQNEKESRLPEPCADFATRLADSILQNTHLQHCPGGLTLDQWSDTLYEVVRGSIYDPTFAASMNHTKDREEEVLPHLTLASEIGLYRRHEIPKDREDWVHFDLEPENFDEVGEIDTATHFGVTCTRQYEDGKVTALAPQRFIAIRPGEGDRAALEVTEKQSELSTSAYPSDLPLFDDTMENTQDIGGVDAKRDEESRANRSKRQKALHAMHSALERASSMFGKNSKASR